MHAQDAVAKDSFMKGLHPDMQLHLKVGDFYKTAGVNCIVEETERLEIAGIKSIISNQFY